MRGQDPSFAELLTLGGIVATIIVGLSKWLSYLNKLDLMPWVSVSGANSIIKPISILLVFVSVLIEVTIVILFILKMTYKYRPSEMPEWLKNTKDGLIEFIYHGPLDLVLGLFFPYLIGVIAVFALLVTKNIVQKLSLIFLLCFFIAWIIWRVSVRLNFPWEKSSSYVLITITIICIPFIILVAINAVLLFTSSIQVKLDQDFYTVGDDVRFQIYSEGVFSQPVIQSVTYSNSNYVIENRTNKSFQGSPVLNVIPSYYLKSESFNSILTIEYKYAFDLSWLGINNDPSAYTLKFVPVYPQKNTSTNITKWNSTKE